ncbi:ATP-dependent DNA helicase MER3 [Exophiala oligosperma]
MNSTRQTQATYNPPSFGAHRRNLASRSRPQRFIQIQRSAYHSPQRNPSLHTPHTPPHGPKLSTAPVVTRDDDLDEFDMSLLEGISHDAPDDPQAEAEPSRAHRPLPLHGSTSNTGNTGPASTWTEPNLRRGPVEIHDWHERAPALHPFSSPTGPDLTSPTMSMLQHRQQIKSAKAESTTSFLQQSYPGEDLYHEGKPSNQPSPRMHHASLPPTTQGIQLVATKTLPGRLRPIFKFEMFNAVQSKCFASAFGTDDNLVVSSPTGSGKTVIMELAICRLAAESTAGDFKVVYQAPTKALCSERNRDWQTKFGHLNLKCAELTGDADSNHLRNVQSANIIITTPEKWDSVTRKWKDHARLIQLVKLFLVDEVHILKENRGATLEAVVSRMKSIGANIRFVALSATVPNSEDIATWLGRNSTMQHMLAQREVFGENFRPVQLTKHVYGFAARGNDFAFESMLTQQLPGVIARHGHGKPVMIFCSTRNASTTTAKKISKAVTSAAGVAFHHGGLDQVDRRTIENAFLTGQINVICSTSTLAVGVNLPCYLVILKGTSAWSDNGLQEYADLEVMQMLGRAGRPQFETSACAVILTRKEKAERYEKMVSGEGILESCLHLNLIEHLNAEIGLGTVYDFSTAKTWLASTFLHVRMKKNPSHYRFKEGIDTVLEDDLLEQLCQKDIALLINAGLVKEQARLVSTEYGQIMARYYINFETMKSFINLPPKAKMSEILSILTQAKEFRDVRMMAGEKSFYKEINKAPEIKFPVKVDVALQAHKVSLLIQAELGNVLIPDNDNYRKHHQQHRIDKSTVFSHANRLIRCIIDCQIYFKDSVSARNALELGRSLAARVWDNTASQLRQLDGLGEVSVRKLASASINGIDVLLNTEPSRIEVVLGKNPPYGHDLLKKLESFPNLRVCVKETGRDLKRGTGATIKLVAEIGFLNETPPLVFKRKDIYVCLLVETSDGTLIDFRRFSAKNLLKGQQVFLSTVVTKPTSNISCYVMCDEIAGTSKYAELRLTDIPSSFFPRQQGPFSEIANNNKPQVKDGRTDEFDDGGVDDQDLLALETNEHDISDVQDIDKILQEEEKTRGKSNGGRRGSELEQKRNRDHKDEGDASSYREPVQLANGRWTCQHDCVQHHRDCKHKCCKEGVTKPKRRPKAPDKKQMKITGLKHVRRKAEPGGSSGGHLEQVSNSKATSNVGIDNGGKTPINEHVSKKLKLSDPDQGDQSSGDNGKVQAQHNRLDVQAIEKANDLHPAIGDSDDEFLFSDDLPDVFPIDGAAKGTCRNELNITATNPETKPPDHGDDDFPDILRYEVDLCGFEPSSRKASTSDVVGPGKGLLITGFSSSPVEQWPSSETNVASEDKSPGSLRRTRDPQIGRLRSSSAATGVMEWSKSHPIESTNRTSRDVVDMEASYPLASIDQTPEERQMCLYEAEEKKKWEGIDSWLYDEFREYVEIV